MANIQATLRPARKTLDRGVIITLFIIAAIYAGVFILEQVIPATSMLFTVLKKGATYALVAVSMNLLNGFTGLFSLGQAGFMLIGAYTYGIFTIGSAARRCVPVLRRRPGAVRDAGDPRAHPSGLLRGIFRVFDRPAGAAP